jgi:hypothetical protein
MSRESAAVIAQVIPVIALALALQLRAVGRALGRQRFDWTDRDVAWKFYPTIIQAVALVVLAIAECQALAQATSDSPQPWWFWLLQVAVVVTFMTPVLDAASSITRSFPDSQRGRRTSRILVEGVSILSGVVLIVVLITTRK